MQDRKTPIAFRIASYNIHKGIGGVDRRYRPERIIETLNRYNPDIVLMQEVDDLVPRSRQDKQVELFAEALEMNYYAYQRNVSLKRGHYGNAILSRFPLVDVQDINLTIPLKKRRRCLLAHCHLKYDGHQRTLLIANLHLGLAAFERRMQLRKILEHHVIQHTHRHTPMIVGGDYNDVWQNLGKQIMVPAGFQASGKAISTFPAAFPARALDHLFFKGDLKLHHAFASRSKIASQASDHLPLIVDFELTTGSETDE